MEPLETVMMFLQEHEKVRVGIGAALSFASGSYVIHMVNKHINPILVGLVLYPFQRSYIGMTCMEFVKREYRQNLEHNYGIRPSQRINVSTP